MCEICGNPHFDFRYVSGEIPGYILNDIEHHPLRPGIQVNIRHHGGHKGLSEDWEIHSQTFMLDFLISGDFLCKVSGERKPTEKTSGCSGICYLQGQTHQLFYQSENYVRWIGILVDRSVMQELILDGANRVSASFRNILEKDHSPPLYVNDRIPPRMPLILNQIFDNPYQGALRQMFVESKALELLLMRLSAHFIEHRSPSSVISRRDRDKMYHIRQILETSLGNTLTLAGLAKQIGMSETRLKQCFRQVFGKPVYEFFKEYRLETAKKMLLSREWNVTEAAVGVGYSSLSHFSQVFRKQFGFSPSHLRKDTN